MPPSVAPPRARKAAPARKGPKILMALIAGESLEAIAEREGLTRKRVEAILVDELGRRWIASTEDYVRLQIARLEAMSAKLAAKAEAGDVAAIDRMLKILDRLDRYHGFSRLTPSPIRQHEGARERLLTKLNTMAERMIAARKAQA
jgi:hypothetical protein